MFGIGTVTVLITLGIGTGAAIYHMVAKEDLKVARREGRERAELSAGTTLSTLSAINSQFKYDNEKLEKVNVGLRSQVKQMHEAVERGDVAGPYQQEAKVYREKYDRLVVEHQRVVEELHQTKTEFLSLGHKYEKHGTLADEQAQAIRDEEIAARESVVNQLTEQLEQAKDVISKLEKQMVFRVEAERKIAQRLANQVAELQENNNNNIPVAASVTASNWSIVAKADPTKKPNRIMVPVENNKEEIQC